MVYVHATNDQLIEFITYRTKYGDTAIGHVADYTIDFLYPNKINTRYFDILKYLVKALENAGATNTQIITHTQKTLERAIAHNYQEVIQLLKNAGTH